MKRPSSPRTTSRPAMPAYAPCGTCTSSIHGSRPWVASMRSCLCARGCGSDGRRARACRPRLYVRSRFERAFGSQGACYQYLYTGTTFTDLNLEGRTHMADYANDVLVDTQWVQEHLD